MARFLVVLVVAFGGAGVLLGPGAGFAGGVSAGTAYPTPTPIRIVLSPRTPTATTRPDPASTAVPAAEACGDPASGWSSATAGGVEGRLRRVLAVSAATDSDPDAAGLAFRVALTNIGARPVTFRPSAFSLLTCDGQTLPPVPSPRRPFFADPETLEPGADAQGWIVVRVPEGAAPALLVFRLEEDGACRGALGFPLVIRTDEPTAARPTPIGGCAGGSATAGVSTGGSPADGPSGADGADGGDATGGDATGGDGCDGGDAVGGDAVGGSGGDGGDAQGGDAQGGDVTGADCAASEE